MSLLDRFHSKNLEDRVAYFENKNMLSQEKEVLCDTTQGNKQGASITIQDTGLYLITGQVSTTYSAPNEQCIGILMLAGSNILTARTGAGNGGGVCISCMRSLNQSQILRLDAYDYGTHSGSKIFTRLQVFKLN